MTQIVVGFTGTRYRLTNPQLALLSQELRQLHLAGAEWLHHGDCVNSDARAHHFWTSFGGKTHGHPPSDPKLRAFCQFDRIEPEKPYLVRNIDIVEVATTMVATPSNLNHIARGSGTWYTIQAALKRGKPTTIIYPNGQIERHQ